MATQPKVGGYNHRHLIALTKSANSDMREVARKITARAEAVALVGDLPLLVARLTQIVADQREAIDAMTSLVYAANDVSAADAASLQQQIDRLYARIEALERDA